MNVLLSYLNLLGCIGWSIFWFILALDKQEDMFGKNLVATFAILLTAGSGIYLFAVGRNSQFTRLQKLKTENSVLEKQIEQAKLRQQLDAIVEKPQNEIL